jgi:hypothetical protein
VDRAARVVVRRVDAGGAVKPMLSVATEKAAPAAAGKRRLGLQAQRLTPSDVARMTTFLRVGSDRLQCAWEVVSGGEVHVLVWSGNEPDTVVGALDGPLASLQLVDPGTGSADSAGVLLRPLQYEAFIDALVALERGYSGPKPPVAKAGPQTALAPAAQGGVAEPAASIAVPKDAHFRLRRWPPAAVLQQDRYHLRLASCMSARHLGIDELVRLSNVGRPQCEAFLATLIANELLDVRLSATTPARPAKLVAVAPRASTPDTSPPPDTSLFSKIRRRLGLTLLR